MRRIIFLSAAIALLGITSSGFAQTMGGGSTGGGGGSTGSTTGGGGGGGSGGGGGGGSGSSSSSGDFSNFSNSFNTGSSTDAASFGGLGQGTTGRTGGGSSTFTVSPTNFLSLSYGNPLFMGRPSASTFGGTPTAIQAGFGQQSFGAVTTNNMNNLNRTGLGNRGLGGTASVSGSTNQQNIARVHHTAELKFPVRPVDVPQLQIDLQGIVSRSSAIKNPSGVTVQMDGRVAVLRGQVTNDDERRLVEGMIRLTPGVQGVKNELQTQSP